jgi:hypothetical protein
MKSKDFLNDEWSQKYKKSINCASPKGFSQRAHCAGRNKNESTDTDADLFGDKSMRDKLHQRLQAAYNSITEEADDLGIDAIFSNAKMFAKLFDKYDDQMSDDPIKDFAYKEPVQKVSRALSELEKIASDVYAYIGEQGVAEAGYGRNRGYSHGFASPTAPSLGGRREREDDEGYGQEEQNNYAVVIDGRTWKVFADKQQAENIARSLRNKGKKASVSITGANPSESVTEADAELAEPPERPRKQQTTTKQKSRLDPNMFAPKQDQPLTKVDPLDDLKKKAGIGGDEPKVNIKKAKQKDTLSRTAGIGSDDMADMLSRMRNIEVDRDLEAYPDEEPPEQLPSVEVNTANLPAVAGQALQAAGVQNPDFHQVANLPGNMADQIRQLGKSLFGSLTMTPTKRIHVVANLGGQGPNSSTEVNAVAGFLKDHGRDLGPGDIDFENVMPGYKAQTHMFTAAGIRWMLVKDFAGQYIYCWPEEDSHDAQDAIGQDRDVKKLK